MLVAISHAPLQKLDSFKARMGWTFDPMAWLRLRDQYEPASGTAARCRS
jgi:hypothetical protein